ncbi:YicC/YloC family endoribonuclease [Humitalea sp. 24SJ18S-53]|uniref:YicC/YloC family endoribonuclease n=1 Tax=Humitalea sp. 24SJ18S-53 TaxID=3422307 RepID=UPI003D66D776
MTLSSMTGFARTSGSLPDGTVFVWELRSVNGRGLDLRLRLPPGQEGLEIPLREVAAKRFSRGSIQAALTLQRQDRAARIAVDPVALDAVLAIALELSARIPGSTPPRAEALLALPGVLRAPQNTPDEAADLATRAALSAGFETALGQLSESRKTEGKALFEVLSTLLDEIAALRDLAARDAALAPAAITARLRASLAELLADTTARMTEERLAVEVAALAQKADVREELDRLSAHIAAARALLASGVPVGRKLEFLTQEFGREANTTAAKSQSLGLTRLALDLKAAIERLREQSANVE